LAVLRDELVTHLQLPAPKRRAGLMRRDAAVLVVTEDGHKVRDLRAFEIDHRQKLPRLDLDGATVRSGNDDLANSACRVGAHCYILPSMPGLKSGTSVASCSREVTPASSVTPSWPRRRRCGIRSLPTR